MTVPTSIYFGASRSARRRVTKELARLKALDAEMAPIRAQIEARISVVKAMPEGHERLMAAAQLEADPALKLLRRPHIPVTLLACRECGHPTVECACGLDWT